MISELEQLALDEQNYRSWPDQSKAYLHQQMRREEITADRLQSDAGFVQAEADRLRRDAERARRNAQQMRESLVKLGFVFIK